MAADTRWWTQGKEPHKELWNTLSTLLYHDRGDRIALAESWRSIYADRQSQDLKDNLFERPKRTRRPVVTNAVDAVHARITKNKPRPWVITIGGDWSLQRRAKSLTDYLDGEFQRLRAYEIGAKAYRISLIVGDAFVKVYEHDGRPEIELVDSTQLFVDPVEEHYDAVRTFYQVRVIDRDVAGGMFPDHRGSLAKAARLPEVREPGLVGLDHGNMIGLIEAWRLGSSKGAADGRHVICTDNDTLWDEEWTRDTFPFVRIACFPDPGRYWSIGLVQRMAGAQSEVNWIANQIDEAFLRAAPKLLCENGSDVSVERITNQPWEEIRYSGTPPQFVTPPAISDQYIVWLDTLVQSMYNDNGISQLSAQSQKPAGLDSGRALLVHQDIETERFMDAGRVYEQFYVDLGNKIIETTDEIVDAGGEHAADLESYVGDDILQAISYKAARLGSNPYRIRVQPVSSLSQSPQGRIQQIEQLMNSGLIKDEHEARRLLSLPDLDNYNTIENAGMDVVDRMLEAAMDGKVSAVNPHMPLEYAYRKAVLTFNRAIMQEAPQDVIEALNAMIGQIATLRAMQQQAAAAVNPSPVGT